MRASHRAALHRLLLKMTGSHEDAEDLAQETLLRAFRRIAEFELRSSFATWLYRIATNAAIDHQRQLLGGASQPTWSPNSLQRGEHGKRLTLGLNSG